MTAPLIDLDLCVRGRPLPVYANSNDRYVEGRAKTPYAIRLRNRSAKRIEVVLTVDGINVITGDDGSFEDDGYILDPFQTTDIKGFLRGAGKAAAFTFGDRGDAYRTKLGRDAAHLGVVGAAVFEEKALPVIRWGIDPPIRFPTWPFPHSPFVWTVTEGPNADDVASTPRGGTTTYSAKGIGGPICGVEANVAAPEANHVYTAQNLGTEYGSEVDFSTRSVRFNRATKRPTQVTELFYDDAAGLRERGIEVGKTKPTPPRPSSFPESEGEQVGCAAPDGWTP